MDGTSVAFRAALAAEVGAFAVCARFALANGTIYRFTSHHSDLVVSGETYSAAAATGMLASDISSTSALDVDNLQVSGTLTSGSITEDDLRAGLWDYAAFTLFQVNYSDLTQGVRYLRTGRLGEVTAGRNRFEAELLGIMKRFARTLGELDTPACRARLGDTRCTVGLGPYTKTGTISSVNADGVTLYDTSRVEAGPTGGVSITGITKANPGVVSFAANAITLTVGQPVTISGVVGMTEVNTVTVVRSPTSSSFALGVDTSSFTTYVSGGTITPFGDSGYFDGGIITFTSGDNDGLSGEVKCYVPGQITLHLPMPYTVAIGDTYSIVAGCDKQYTTCRDRFSNLANFRGEPYLPGLDRVVQTGRH